MNIAHCRTPGSLVLLFSLALSLMGAGAVSAQELFYQPWTGGPADPPHPATPFFTKGEPVTTTVIADGLQGVVLFNGIEGRAIFNYDNNTTQNTGGARGSWQFLSTATQDGPVTMDWRYTGYHATKKVYANLEAFVVRNGEHLFSPLVEAGPGDRGAEPSGGFDYSGTTTLELMAGEVFGFRIAGGNSDQESTLHGTLYIDFNFPLVANEIDDAVFAEVDTAQSVTVDLSNAFSSPVGFELSIDNVSNADLFGPGEVSLSGTDLSLPLAENQNGSATIRIEAVNETGASALNSLDVIVTAVNDAPVALEPGPADIDLQLGVSPNPLLDLSQYFEDVDLAIEGDTLTYSASAAGGGVVKLTLTGSLLEIEGISVGSTTINLGVTDAAGASAGTSFTVTATDPALLGAANLVHSVPLSSGNVGIAVSAGGEPGESTQVIELLTSASCENGSIGADAVVFGEIPVDGFDANGEFFTIDIISAQAPLSTYAVARLSSGFTVGENSDCIVAGPDNDSWVRALDIPLSPDSSGEISFGGESGYLDRAGNARWFRFTVQAGARATLDLSNLPQDFDLFLFKDIAQAFQELEGASDVDGLNRLGAEFAPSTFAPSTFAPSVFAPSTFAPDAYSPSQFAPSTFAPSLFAPSLFAPSTFAPSTFAPSTFAPSTFAPSTFAPSTFAPSTFAPSTFAPSIFAPENFVSAQLRSLIAVSAITGTGTERVIADTWNNTGNFYVRVSGKNGAFDLAQAFNLAVELKGVDCSGVAPLPGPANASAGGYRSIILWDSARIAGDSENSTAEIDALGTNLQALAARPEVDGVIVDLATYDHVQALHAQADANTACPYAENLTAAAIKSVIDDYRDLNPGMEYVVLVGGDGHIPFYRGPDQSQLGPEQDYDPPMANDTQSQSALRLNYILGQDYYGAETILSLRDGSLPLPSLAVGRLVETAVDMNTVLEAYLATPGGVISTPTATLVTGYDFLTDTANAIQAELVAATAGGRNDTLITAADISPDDERSWTADDLRRELLDEGEDIVFLAGHFSANSALAADYTTTALTTELVSSDVDLSNALVYSAGCHSGYNIVNPEIVPGVTLSLDWPQAFARKGATLIAGTGYQYGDTDFIEYGERLYLAFTRELRTGSGPVSIGKALVRAKQDYLETTPDLRGLHRKSVIISTLFGLPMLSVDLPGRIPADEPSPAVSPTLVSGGPGEVLGLRSADINFLFEAGADGLLVEKVEQLKNIETGDTLNAFYLEGADGIISYPAEPTLPLVTRDVRAAGLSLRGVGFRGGSWQQILRLPLTGAATTELRGVHTPFSSPVLFPMRLATPNYFDALTGGGSTLLHVTPTQHRVDNVGDFDAIRRQFDTLDYRLYYSDNTQTYGPNLPALASAPTFSGVTATADGADVVFSANVVADPSAGVHAVWVTYTDGGDMSGDWISVDLEQDPEVSTLWSYRLQGAVGAFDRLDFVVQAVSGTGLVTLDDNFGAFYRIGGTGGEFDTEMTVSGPVTGIYGDSVSLNATLSSGQIPIQGASVIFTIGGSGRAGITNGDGDVTVELPITATPGGYAVIASFAGDADYAPSSASQDIAVDKAATGLDLQLGQQSIGTDGIDPGVSADLTDQFGTPLLQRTVYFTLVNAAGDLWTFPVITDKTGRADLPRLLLPAGDYELTVRFLGDIPTPAGVQVLDDPVYEASAANATLTLEIGNNCPTDVFEDPGSNDPTLEITGFCYLAFDVRGKANISEGTLIVGEGVRIDKKVDQFGEGGVIVLEGGSIGDKVFESGPGDIIVYGTVENQVIEAGAGDVILDVNGFINGNVDESGEGSMIIRGAAAGNVRETDSGDLTIASTGQVNGNATEKGEGSLSNEGSVSGGVSQD
jgi:hypothetical protein